MNNEIKRLNKAGRLDGVKALENAGFPALRSGLGVPNGSYNFVTPNNEEIYATKAITTAKGNFGLTLIAGILTGKEDNRSVSIGYGISATDKQFVVTYDQFMLVEPNQAYDVEVLNGRVKSIMLAESSNIVDSEEIVTKSKGRRASLEV